MVDGVKESHSTELPLVSIVILSYNSAEYLPACLSSIARTDYPRFEVVIADNASRDDSVAVAERLRAELHPEAKVLSLPDNKGCAGGNNAGWRASKGRIVLFLNPDTEIEVDFVSKLVSAMTGDERIGIVGSKIYYPDSRILQHAGGIVHPNGMTRHYGAGEEDSGRYDQLKDVAYVTGAGFAIRRDLLEKLDGFDEDYFPAYYEEVDLCTRVRRLGFRVVYVPEAVMFHHESVALTVNSPAFHRLYQRMRIRYCIKNLRLHQWLFGFIPFEIYWMLFCRYARGHRREQLRAYRDGLTWILNGRPQKQE